MLNTLHDGPFSQMKEQGDIHVHHYQKGENPEDKNGENWYLAFAAYNCGASRVLKEMKRSNSNNFWDLNRLPGQTRNYVPKILAIFIKFSPFGGIFT